MSINKLFAAAAFSMIAGFNFSTTANAAPISIAPIVSPAEGLIEKVEHRRGFYRHGNRAYYNGQRGYRDYRRGYRRHNGFFFPNSAFSFQIYIGPRRHVAPGYIVRRVPVRPRIINIGTLHVNWCYSKYRSYRASDNSFQPYYGPRKRCYSPYSR